MSGLSPSGPSQPTLDQAYETPGNPATTSASEDAAAKAQSQSSAPAVDKRIPREQSTSQSQATPTPVARGVRGAPPGEEANGLTDDDVGRSNELDGEQMAAPGEGEIAAAVDRKPGASGAAPGLETDLDRKKAEQAPAREAVKEQKKAEVDVAGVLGQTGGPANPVDRDGYPNKGSA